MSARSSIRTKGRTTPQETLLGRLLDPIDRLSETIYSILIVLTFTLAFSILRLEDSGSATPVADTTDLFLAALGATLAWGLIDGIMHVLMEAFQRGERHRLLLQIQTAETEQARVAAIAEELDYVLEPISSENERKALYSHVVTHLRHSQPQRVGFRREDFSGALGCVIVALLAVLPSLVPLLLLREHYALAVRASNVISFIMLFINGYRWGNYTGASPWKTGLLLVSIGAVMVLIAIPLGG